MRAAQRRPVGREGAGCRAHPRPHSPATRHAAPNGDRHRPQGEGLSGRFAPRPRGAAPVPASPARAAETRYLRRDGPPSPPASPGSRQHLPPLPADPAATIFVKGKVWRSPPEARRFEAGKRRPHLPREKASRAGETLHLAGDRALSHPAKKVNQASPQAAPLPSPGRGGSGVPHLIGATEAKPAGAATETTKSRWQPPADGRQKAAAADYISQHAVLRQRAPETTFPALQRRPGSLPCGARLQLPSGAARPGRRGGEGGPWGGAGK